MTRSERKSRRKSKAKHSSRKREHSLKQIVKNGVLLANEKQGNFSKRNLLGSNHLLQQTKQTNKLRKLKQLTLQEKHIVHEAIKI